MWILFIHVDTCSVPVTSPAYYQRGYLADPDSDRLWVCVAADLMWVTEAFWMIASIVDCVCSTLYAVKELGVQWLLTVACRGLVTFSLDRSMLKSFNCVSCQFSCVRCRSLHQHGSQSKPSTVWHREQPSKQNAQRWLWTDMGCCYWRWIQFSGRRYLHQWCSESDCDSLGGFAQRHGVVSTVRHANWRHLVLFRSERRRLVSSAVASYELQKHFVFAVNRHGVTVNSASSSKIITYWGAGEWN